MAVVKKGVCYYGKRHGSKDLTMTQYFPMHMVKKIKLYLISHVFFQVISIFASRLNL